MPDRFFGELPNAPVGSTWSSRAEVARAGVHRPNVSGISGTKAEGADSVVISGGYEDDEDYGDEIIFTGAGANDSSTGRQIRDQEIDQSGVAGLITSELQGLPVRVVRGAGAKSEHSPATGFRFDGLYRVAEHWPDTGRSGFQIWRFKLIRLSTEEALPYAPDLTAPPGSELPGSITGVITRVIRSTAVSEWVKRLYGHACQVCDTELHVPADRAVAEGAHIRPLGRPHSGPDVPDNVLCLCPNHHTLFDLGGIFIDDQYRAHDYRGRLLGPVTRKATHRPNPDHLRYHREQMGPSGVAGPRTPSDLCCELN